MIHEYEELKQTLQLPADAVLPLFEQYCELASPAIGAMEWSWKIVGWEETLANRVFWLGAPGHREVTGRCLNWLTSALGYRAESVAGGLDAWNGLVSTNTDHALVAYAGRNLLAGTDPVIKICLVLDRCDAEIYGQFIRPISPLLPACPPPECATVFFGQTIDAAGSSASRVYLLFDREAFDQPEVGAYVSAIAGAAALEVARTYPRCGIGLKQDTTDMLGIGLRPTGRRALPMDYLASPAMVPLVNAAARIPALGARLNRVTWMSVPIDDESLSFPRKLKEMNVYVLLRSGAA
jgi:hypothetical protein